ncbi:DUF3817 domain-containing protein [Corynebacterium lubricantis]|uniref:DUF3817 domain-containing protein n=1 Tax=Corynebacterium lubricantis TaxID=541095 RepID=UPI00037D072A|nr:DUF3817 domain-containing protein [Corynebacterium lubricantis]
MSSLTPKKLHLSVAILEFFTWTFLIVGMVLKYSGVTDAVTPIAGGIHGFGFLCFVVLTILVWVNNSWTAGVGIVGLAVSLIPWAALPFSIWAERSGRLEGGWRFSDPSEQPQSLPEKALAQVVRHPVRSLIIIVVLVAIVFAILLAIGQPYDPDAIADQIQ